MAHHTVDVFEELLDKIPQSAQVLARVPLSFYSFSLSPSYRFVQPKLHLLDRYQRICSDLHVGLLLQRKHPAAGRQRVLKSGKKLQTTL